MSHFNFGAHPNPQANTPAPRVPVTVVPVGDLILAPDENVAKYTLNGRTYDVIVSHSLWTVPELVESVKLAGVDENLNPWIEEGAFEAGIRVTF